MSEIQLIKEEHEKDIQLGRLTNWRRQKLNKLIIDQHEERSLFERKLIQEREEKEKKLKELERKKSELSKFKSEKEKERQNEFEEEAKHQAQLEALRRDEIKVNRPK
jgi:hypothetical protein